MESASPAGGFAVVGRLADGSVHEFDKDGQRRPGVVARVVVREGVTSRQRDVERLARVFESDLTFPAGPARVEALRVEEEGTAVGVIGRARRFGQERVPLEAVQVEAEGGQARNVASVVV